ncbi:MAG: hypothetical protein LUI85_02525 [Bacteroides sp.]|nr:hypothetical protein [Bacteroides sp.]
MLEGLHESIINRCKKKKLFRIVPEFDEIHEQFERMQTASQMPICFRGDIFHKDWNIYSTKEQFKICWSIEVLNRLVQQEKSQPNKFLIEQLEHQYDDLDEIKVKQYELQDKIAPIIVVDYYGKLLVVDGNHRLQSRINKREKSIIGYYIPANIHTKALFNEQSFAIYTYYHNCNILAKICQEKN